MITGKKEELDNIAKDYVCKEHGTRVIVTWQAKENAYVLLCEKGEFPEEVTRQPTLTEMYKQRQELPEPIQSNVKRGIEKRARRLPSAPVTEEFAGIPLADLETGVVLTPGQLQALADYARKYGLDPARGHVALMHGEPYFTIDAYLYHARQQNVPYSLTGRPLGVDELEAQGYGIGDLGWFSRVERKDTGQIFEGYGFVTNDERTQMSKRNPDQHAHPVVHEKPGNMVIKRADWQALRRAFPIGESPQGGQTEA